MRLKSSISCWRRDPPSAFALRASADRSLIRRISSDSIFNSQDASPALRPSYPAHAGGGIQYAAAFRFNRWRLGNTGSPAGACHRAAVRPTRWRAMTSGNSFAIPRRDAPEVVQIVPPQGNQRAQGTPGARCTRSLVCSVLVAHECSHHRSPEHPAFPAQWFYGLCRALPGDEFVLSPSSAD
jgi:hypothetical protein